MLSSSALAFALSIVFACVFAWGLIAPFFAKDQDLSSHEVESSELKKALLRKETLLTALEELEHDFLAGKIGEDDYKESKRELNEETAACLLEIDAATT